MSAKSDTNWGVYDYMVFGTMGATVVVGAINLILLWRNDGKMNDADLQLLGDAASSLANAHH